MINPLARLSRMPQSAALWLRSGAFVAWTAVLCAAAAAPAAADRVLLEGGGEVVGKPLPRSANGDYVVRTEDGATVAVARQDVAKIVQESPQQIEYRTRARAAADAVEAHRRLAEWCRRHGLIAEADLHLRRIVELNPDDEEARQSLGYRRIAGQWLSREETMAERGLQLYDGKYRTPQDIALRQRDEQRRELETQWFANLRLWLQWLASDRPARVEEARQRLGAVDDPQATAAVVKLMDQQDDPYLFDVLLELLTRLSHPLATETLVALSLDSDSATTRAACLDALTDGSRRVSVIPYVQALNSKDNRIVNRAGVALGRLGDPAAISPLIDALVTRHKYQVSTGSGPGQMNAGFDPSGQGGGGLAFGGGPKIVQQDRENPRVLQALTKLAGSQEFEYDQAAWRRWFVNQQTHDRINARRDE